VSALGWTYSSAALAVGRGPLGLAVSRELRHEGKPFRLVSRGGRSDGSAGTGIVVADVSDAADARRAFEVHLWSTNAPLPGTHSGRP
jgi:hypothetical protein